jgi:hypothetical protein
MNDNFEIPEVYGDIVIDIEERFEALHVWTKYSMFTHSNIVEIKCGDEESFNVGMKHFVLYQEEFAEIKSVVGIEDDLKILVLFGEE